MTMEAVVEFEYQAEQEDELTLKVGEVISNVQTAEGGWWEGELNGKKGMFPENFVKLMKKKETPPTKKEEKREATQRKSVRELASKFKDGVPMGSAPPKKKENKKFCKVLFEYKKENDDELELNIGEIVEFHKQVEEGWWEGTLNGRHGVFPSNFVEMIEDEPPAPPAEEKPAPPVNAPAPPTEKEENFHTIKGKKVMGVGLGNIFGEGPIKLRATGGGNKKDEPPAKEPSKPSKPPEPEPVPAAAKREKPSIHEQAVVRFSYAAEQPDELCLVEGQIVRILDKELEDEGWWKGELNGKEGVFPDNFVELLPQEEPPKPKKPPPPSSSVKHNNQHLKMAEKASMGDGKDKTKPDTAPILPSAKKPSAPPPIGKKPSSQKFGDGVLPSGPKPEPTPPAKPVAGPGRGKEDHSDHHVNNEDAAGFDSLESSTQKLTHLTANRNKGPKKRPPSTVLTLNDGGDKDQDQQDGGVVNNISSSEKAQPPLPPRDLEHASRVEPSPVQLRHPPEPAPQVNRAPPTAPSTTISSQAQRPSEPTTAPPSQTSTASMHQTNKLLERLQKELDDLKANSVSRSEYNALRKEHDSLKSDFESLRSQHSKKLFELMNEVDDEKKLRLSTQVEIERVKKLLTESHV